MHVPVVLFRFCFFVWLKARKEFGPVVGDWEGGLMFGVWMWDFGISVIAWRDGNVLTGSTEVVGEEKFGLSAGVQRTSARSACRGSKSLQEIERFGGQRAKANYQRWK